jgi:hypothetical protein
VTSGTIQVSNRAVYNNNNNNNNNNKVNLCKRPLGRPRRRWVDNIKMDLREIGWVDMVWYGMVWNGLFWLRIGNSGGLL